MKNRSKGIFTFYILCTVLLTSCPSPESSPEIILPENAPVIISGIEFLGRGYDTCGNYADPESLRAEVLDYDALKSNGLIESIQLEKSEFKTIVGQTIEEYMNELTVETGVSGSYGGFSGSVKVNFSEGFYSYTDYSFATVQSIIHKYSAKIKMDAAIETLKTHLTDNARTAINNPDVAPNEIFSIYGTHVLRGMILGGRIDYNVTANMFKVESDMSIGVFTEASYDGIFSASISSGIVNETEMNSFRSESAARLKVYGGSSEYGQYIINEDESGYQPWIESLADNPVFCNFDKTAPLIAIWEFCDDESRQNELETGFNQWVIDRAIETGPLATEPRHVVLGILAEIYNNQGDYIDENGLKHLRIDTDLNREAGGDTVCLYVCIDWDNDPAHPPITGVVIYNQTDSEPLPGSDYNSTGTNLNSNAGGSDNLYLYYSKNPDNEPITSIRVFNWSYTQRFYPETYCANDADGAGAEPGTYPQLADLYYETVQNTASSSTDQDVNEDALFGDTIYLEYSIDPID